MSINEMTKEMMNFINANNKVLVTNPEVGKTYKLIDHEYSYARELNAGFTTDWEKCKRYMFGSSQFNENNTDISNFGTRVYEDSKDLTYEVTMTITKIKERKNGSFFIYYDWSYDKVEPVYENNKIVDYRIGHHTGHSRLSYNKNNNGIAYISSDAGIHDCKAIVEI